MPRKHVRERIWQFILAILLSGIWRLVGARAFLAIQTTQWQLSGQSLTMSQNRQSGSQVSILGRNTRCFPHLEACMAPSATTLGWEETVSSVPGQVTVGLVSEVHGVFSNRELTSPSYRTTKGNSNVLWCSFVR